MAKSEDTRRLVTQKKCSKCGVVKNVEEFHKAKKNKDGLKGACKKCCLSYDVKYRKDYLLGLRR